MNNKIKRINEDMNTMIRDAVDEHLFKYLEQDDLINIMDSKFKSTHSKLKVKLIRAWKYRRFRQKCQVKIYAARKQL